MTPVSTKHHYDDSLLLFSCSNVFDSETPWNVTWPGSSEHGIPQARILEWVAISSTRGSSPPRDGTCIFWTDRWVLYHWAIYDGCQMVTLSIISWQNFPSEPMCPLIYLILKLSSSGQWRPLQSGPYTLWTHSLPWAWLCILAQGVSGSYTPFHAAPRNKPHLQGYDSF